jgi:DNA polymerase III subunit gamma/tau
MSEKYIPLYRKYRPKNLSEVIGQEHIKKALTNAISLNKISHAYLFTGPRGTGKTSVARILAKSLNCKESPTVTPCEICPSCIDIKNSTPMDVIEIDAASNRKVEDAQNILEKIQYIPVNGKYKIYIIDEVHMLTNHAFNALLKTLEEPPENVIFILATTEPQKVLETITSRCQRFDFRRITTDDIVNHLKNIAKLEKIKIDDDALFTIAKNAAGGMRDSIAMLDQISILDSSKTITSDDINKLLGRISFDMLYNLSQNIIQSNPQEAIELLEKIYNSGNEPSQILINLMGYLKNLLIVKNCQSNELLVDLTQLNNSQLQTLKTQSENIETHQITFLIEKTVYYIKELKTNINQHLWLEVAVIDLANLTQNTSLLELQERISRLESGNKEMENGKWKMENKLDLPAQQQKIEEIKEAIQENPSPQTSPAGGEEVNPSPVHPFTPSPSSHLSPLTSHSQLWLELLQNIASTPTVSLLTQHARLIEISDEKVVIGCKENFLKMLNSDNKKASIEEGVKKLFGKSLNVVIKTADSKDFSAVEKKNPIIEKQETGNDKQETAELETEDINEDDDFIEHELAKKKEEKIIPSDQVSMVVNLFDGKYID